MSVQPPCMVGSKKQERAIGLKIPSQPSCTKLAASLAQHLGTFGRCRGNLKKKNQYKFRPKFMSMKSCADKSAHQNKVRGHSSNGPNKMTGISTDGGARKA